jgi:hypothetical protein
VLCLICIPHLVLAQVSGDSEYLYRLAQLSRVYLKTETETSGRNIVFWKINRTVFSYKDKIIKMIKN